MMMMRNDATITENVYKEANKKGTQLGYSFEFYFYLEISMKYFTAYTHVIIMPVAYRCLYLCYD